MRKVALSLARIPANENQFKDGDDDDDDDDDDAGDVDVDDDGDDMSHHHTAEPRSLQLLWPAHWRQLRWVWGNPGTG